MQILSEVLNGMIQYHIINNAIQITYSAFYYLYEAILNSIICYRTTHESTPYQLSIAETLHSLPT